MGKYSERRKMRHNTHIMRDRFVTFGEKFRAIFGLRAKAYKVTANPLPAHLRPWVPKNEALIALTDYRRVFERTEYITDLKFACADTQWAHLCQQYPRLKNNG